MATGRPKNPLLCCFFCLALLLDVSAGEEEINSVSLFLQENQLGAERNREVHGEPFLHQVASGNRAVGGSVVVKLQLILFRCRQSA